MKYMRKIALCLSLALMLSMSLTACGDSEKPAASSGAEEPNKEAIVIKLGHTTAEDSAYHYAASKFAELVDEKSDGAIRVDIYPNSQLGADRDMLEGLTLNTVQMSMPGGLTLASYEPSIAILSLPFLYENREQAYAVLDSEVAQEVYSASLNFGVRVLASADNGFRQLGTKDPVNSLEDLKGMKIRVPDSALYMDTWTLLGAAPSPTAWNELFSALQTGVVDGEEAPLGIFGTSGFGEICKNFAYINYLYDAPVLAIGENFYQSLSAEHQQILSEAAKEACVLEREWVQEDETKWQEKIETQWGVTFTNPDLKPFQDAVAPIYKNYDQATLEKIFEILGR